MKGNFLIPINMIWIFVVVDWLEFCILVIHTHAYRTLLVTEMTLDGLGTRKRSSVWPKSAFARNVKEIKIKVGVHVLYCVSQHPCQCLLFENIRTFIVLRCSLPILQSPKNHLFTGNCWNTESIRWCLFPLLVGVTLSKRSTQLICACTGRSWEQTGKVYCHHKEHASVTEWRVWHTCISFL